MAFISCGKINKKIFYSIIGGILKFLFDFILKMMRDNNDINLAKQPFMLGFNASLGLCLSFIPYLIFKKNYDYLKQRRVSEDEKLIYNDSDDLIYEKRENKHYPLLIFSFCDFFQKFLSFIYHGLDNFWVFDTLFIMIFSYFILKMKLYTHHFISLILILIFGIVIIVIYNLDEERNWELFFQILNTFIVEILFSLEIVVAKYAIEFKYCSPYEICLFCGILSLIIFSFLLIIFTFIPMSEIKYIKKVEYEGKMYVDNLIYYFSNLSLIEVIYFILSMVQRFGFNIFCLLTTKYCTPSHIVIILILGEIYFGVPTEPLWKEIVEYIIYAFLVFDMLIFLEIIELNCLGIQKNTEKNITTRARELDLKINEDEFEEEKEDE